MKTFEERYTAWIDGQLTGDTLAAFERELAEKGDTPDLAQTRAGLSEFHTFFQTHSIAPQLENPDFFNHRILEQIRDTSPAPAGHRPWFTIPKLFWMGGFSTVTAIVLFLAVIPKKSESHSQSAYIAQVISARSADPRISATALKSQSAQEQKEISVVWLDGLDYVPANAQ